MKKLLVFFVICFNVVSYSQIVLVNPVSSKDGRISFEKNVDHWVIIAMKRNIEGELNKKAIERVAKEFELTKVGHLNDQLAFKDGDISYFYEQCQKYGWDEEYLRLEFAARKIILIAFNRQGVVIETSGELSHLAGQIKADIKRGKKILQNSLQK